jgi:hypothetical protein
MTICPHCGKAINPAALLGALTAGGKKRITDSDRAARSLRLAAARKKRWPKK